MTTREDLREAIAWERHRCFISGVRATYPYVKWNKLTEIQRNAWRNNPATERLLYLIDEYAEGSQANPLREHLEKAVNWVSRINTANQFGRATRVLFKRAIRSEIEAACKVLRDSEQ